MRFLSALPAAIFGCLLTAPIALAADGEEASIDPNAGDAAKTAAQSASTGGSLVRTIVGLAVVLGVIYGLYWVLKQVKNAKDSAGDTGENLETIASLSLGTHRSLHLVRVGPEIVLLGAAEHQITPIRRYTESEAHALGLLEPPVTTLASLETETVAPKGFMDILRSKTTVR